MEKVIAFRKIRRLRGIKMLAKALVVAVLSAISVHASALCMATPPESTDRPYDYYVALTEALQLAKQARDETAAALSRGTSDRQPAATLLTMLKTSQADYACAQQYIEGYTKSKNYGIEVSAKG